MGVSAPLPSRTSSLWGGPAGLPRLSSPPLTLFSSPFQPFYCPSSHLFFFIQSQSLLPHPTRALSPYCHSPHTFPSFSPHLSILLLHLVSSPCWSSLTSVFLSLPPYTFFLSCSSPCPPLFSSPKVPPLLPPSTPHLCVTCTSMGLLHDLISSSASRAPLWDTMLVRVCIPSAGWEGSPSPSCCRRQDAP